jgi:predicted  nucleic acid-binding Zn-ribbon protein
VNPEDFIKARERSGKESGRRILISLLLFFLLAIGYALFIYVFMKYFENPSHFIRILFSIPLFIFGPGLIIILAWHGEATHRKFGLYCHYCGCVYRLYGPKDVLLNRCKKCGKSIIEYGNSAGEAVENKSSFVPELSALEFRERIKKFEKRFYTTALASTVSLGALMVLIVILTVECAKRWPTPLFKLSYLAVLIILVSIFGIIFYLNPKLRKRFGLFCPNCHVFYDLRDLDEFILNKCRKCGTPLFRHDINQQHPPNIRAVDK